MVNAFLEKCMQEAEYYSKIKLQDLVDSGFAGNKKDRDFYDRKRMVHFKNLPDWANKRIKKIADEQLKRWPETKTKDLKAFLQEIRQPSIKSTKRRLERNRENISRARRVEKAYGLQPQNPAEMNRKRTAFLKSLEDTTNLTVNAVVLEDFLSLHPAVLTDEQKWRLTFGNESHWELANKRIIKQILKAEAELQGVFEKFSATPEERAGAVGRLATRMTENERQKIIADFEKSRGIERKPEEKPRRNGKEKQQATVSTQEPDALKKFVKKFVEENMPHLGKLERGEVIRTVLDLHTRRLMNADEMLEKLKNYSGKDHHVFARLLHREYTEVDAEMKNTPQRPIEPPELPPTESPEKIIGRIDASHWVNYSDITHLKALLLHGQVPKEFFNRALEHILLFHLAGGGFKIKIKDTSIVRKTLPSHLVGDGDDVLSKLKSEGKVVSRYGTPRKPFVVVSERVLPKYGH